MHRAGVTFDSDRRRWASEIRERVVRITRDAGVAVTTERVSGPDALPETCDRAGVYLLVFNGAAEFRRIGLTGI